MTDFSFPVFQDWVDSLPLVECAPILSLSRSCSEQDKQLKVVAEWAAAKSALAGKYGACRAIGPRPGQYAGATCPVGQKIWVFFPWRKPVTEDTAPWRGRGHEPYYRRVFRPQGVCWRSLPVVAGNLRDVSKAWEYVVAGESVWLEEWWKVWCNFPSGRGSWCTSQRCPKPGALAAWEQWIPGPRRLTEGELQAVFGYAA